MLVRLDVGLLDVRTSRKDHSPAMTLFAFSIPMTMFHIYGYAVPLVILAFLYGFRWKAGLWGNCLALGAVLFSMLIAFGWWEELAYIIARQFPPMLFLADCVAFWVLFIVSLGIFDTVTRFISTVKVKFHDKVESIGNGLVLFLLFFAVYGVYLFAEDIGPVGEHQRDTPPRAEFIPLATFRILSTGNLAGFTQTNPFDANQDLQKKHLERRHAIMLNMQGEGGTIRAEEALFNKLRDSRQQR